MRTPESIVVFHDTIHGTVDGLSYTETVTAYVNAGEHGPLVDTFIEVDGIKVLDKTGLSQRQCHAIHRPISLRCEDDLFGDIQYLDNVLGVILAEVFCPVCESNECKDGE